MTVRSRITLPDGREWGVEYPPLSVLVPLEEIENLSDAEIGYYVRQLIPHAVDAMAYEILGYREMYRQTPQREAAEIEDGYNEDVYSLIMKGLK